MPFDSPVQHVTNWIVEDFRTREGVDLSHDSLALQRIREAVEKAKDELSTKQSIEINIPFITADRSGPKHLFVELRRAQLERPFSSR